MEKNTFSSSEEYIRKHGLKIRLSQPQLASFFIEHLDFYLSLSRATSNELVENGILRYRDEAGENTGSSGGFEWLDEEAMAAAVGIAELIIQDPIINAQINASEFLQPASARAIMQQFTDRLDKPLGLDHKPVINNLLLDRLPKNLSASISC